jgi:hypothetical protein
VLTPVSGAILALLFVALQVSQIPWDEVPLRRAAAVRSLIELASPLIVGLFALYPGGWWWLGALVAGCAGLASVIWYLIMYILLRRQGYKMTWYDQQQAIGGSSVTPTIYVLMLVGSYLNNDFGLHLVGWLCIWGTTAGVVQSWLLLTVKAPPGAKPEVTPARRFVVSGLPDGRFVVSGLPGGQTVEATVPPGGKAEVRSMPDGGVCVSNPTLDSEFVFTATPDPTATP